MPAWDQLAVGVAAILGLVYVARTLRRTMRDVLGFLSNHMTSHTEALIDVRVALERVADRLERLESTTRRRRAAP
jgi:hypothetical protein